MKENRMTQEKEDEGRGKGYQEISEHFGCVEDPRRFNSRHMLLDIIVISICAVICGADNWSAIEEFGKTKEDWLRTFLELPHGIPSADTFRRVFSRIDPEQLEEGFRSFVTALRDLANAGVADSGDAEGKQISLDGKCLRHSYDIENGISAIHMVSAWARENGLVLGQVKVDEKSNEITAIPKLLELLDLEGNTVTIDAMGCQRDIARQIVEGGGEYVLSVKGNQESLHDDVISLFESAEETSYEDVSHSDHESLEKDHGRIETRHVTVITQPDYIDYLRYDRRVNGSIRGEKWLGLSSIVRVESTRLVKEKGIEKEEHQTRYYISSLNRDAENLGELLGRYIRGHWGIENSLHWVLDMAFGEDDSRLRIGHGAQNFSILRRLALNLLKADTSVKAGIKTKRLKAGWNNQYLLKILNPRKPS
jgi:predicted transposase YbfD/YdcC